MAEPVINGNGLLSQTQKPYVPEKVNMGLMNSAGKPDANWVNHDKVKELEARRYADQLKAQQDQADFQQQQAYTQQQQYEESKQHQMDVENKPKKGKIICQRYAELSILTPELNVLDQAYGKRLMRENPSWQRGYLRYAPHIVKRLHNTTWQSKLLIKVLTPFIKCWAQQMGHLEGGDYKYNHFGNFLMKLCVSVFVSLDKYRLMKIRAKSFFRGLRN